MKIARIFGIVIALGIVIAAGYWFFVARPDAPSVEVTARITAIDDERLSKGASAAPVQMTEYIDMFCSSCARAHEEVIPKIESEFITRDKLHYEVRVVAKINHPDASTAANGAYCAAEQKKFWNYLDIVYGQTAQLYKANSDPRAITLFSGASLRNIARDAGVNVPKWENCVKKNTYDQTIQKNEKDLSALNGYGTPHSVINGENYNGAPPYSTFKTVINAALDTVEKQKEKE